MKSVDQSTETSMDRQIAKEAAVFVSNETVVK